MKVQRLAKSHALAAITCIAALPAFLETESSNEVKLLTSPFFVVLPQGFSKSFPTKITPPWA